MNVGGSADGKSRVLTDIADRKNLECDECSKLQATSLGLRKVTKGEP